jgi:aminoglycoside phosphotransferase (APT) family kinase protein
MAEAAGDAAIARVVARLAPGSRLRRAWPLYGGVSAQLTAFEMTTPEGYTERLVLRRHGPVDLASDPDIAAHEFQLLRLLHSAGLAVPAPRYLDHSCELYPTPYLVLEYVDGEPTGALSDAAARTPELAACLARIHDLGASPGLSFLPQLGRGYGTRTELIDSSLQEGRIREALASLRPLPGTNRPTLLHGDYWPGNVLWRDGAIAAVIDWEDAALGDPLADLGNSRLEVLWAFGQEAMERYTGCYRSHMPQLAYANLPYWDLCAALRPASKLGNWGLDAATEATMRERHCWFVSRALAGLSALRR